MGARMGSDAADAFHGTVAATPKGHRTCKSKAKVPRRVHKSEREKLKREQLNDLFEHLADTLEMEPPNNGKASVLNEAARMLKDLLVQINILKKENASLLSESRYVTIEKNELQEENSVLETQIGNLQSDLRETKLDLNIIAPAAPHFPGCPASSQQPPAVFVLPVNSDMHYLSAMQSHVRKPYARYPTAADSWPLQLLGRKEVHVGDNSDIVCKTLMNKDD